MSFGGRHRACGGEGLPRTQKSRGPAWDAGRLGGRLHPQHKGKEDSQDTSTALCEGPTS